MRRIHADLLYCYKVFNRLVRYEVADLLFLAPLISSKWNCNKLYSKFAKLDVLNYSFFQVNVISKSQLTGTVHRSANLTQHRILYYCNLWDKCRPMKYLEHVEIAQLRKLDMFGNR